MSQIYRIDYDTSYNCNPSFEYAISYDNALRFKKYIELTRELTGEVKITPVSTIDDWVVNKEIEDA